MLPLQVLPLSLPVIMSVTLFFMVDYWNSYYSYVYYCYDPDLRPLQVVLREIIKKATGDAEGWHLTVLAAEIFTPSSHIQVLFESEILPKASLMKEILGEITAIPADDPALTRCLLSVGAPCLSLLIGRRGIPGPLQDLAQQPPEVLVEHLHGFALGQFTARHRVLDFRGLHVSDSNYRRTTANDGALAAEGLWRTTVAPAIWV